VDAHAVLHGSPAALVRAEAELGVRAYGEMVALLWDEGNVTAAIELEALWNELAQQLPFSLLCAYANDPPDSDRAGEIREVCLMHTGVVPSHAGPNAGAGAPPTEGATAVRQFTSDFHSVGRARRFALDALVARDVDDGVIHDTALIVSELATNAVLHARSPFTLEVRVDAEVVRIGVHDASPVSPQPRHQEPTAQSGRGLCLVSTLADTWGTELHGDGKIVWAHLRR